ARLLFLLTVEIPIKEIEPLIGKTFRQKLCRRVERHPAKVGLPLIDRYMSQHRVELGEKLWRHYVQLVDSRRIPRGEIRRPVKIWRGCLSVAHLHPFVCILWIALSD